MVFVTGDKHGDLTEIIDFVQRFELNKDDSIIVLGDMGMCWRKDKKDLKYNVDLWTVRGNGVKLYFIDGNHENFRILNSLPIENNMHKVADNIYHLLRGQVYEFEGKKILTMGGADSVDWFLRTKNLDWWEEETISQEDIDRVPAGHYDYVLTHCCPRNVFEENKVYLITLGRIDQDKVNHNSEDKLQQLFEKITFNHHYFGHYHIDKDLDGNHTCLYNEFRELK
jgi:UDP-2,3-diacylglucosamine pyrophosphatase LpxH